MPIDPADIGQLTMRFLDHVTDEYGDEAALLRTVVMAEVVYPDPDEPGTTKTTVLWDTDEHSPVAKFGLVEFVARVLGP